MGVTLIGAGPGDPELMTRKAWRVLGLADVVLHDALMDVEGMKQAAPRAKWLDVGKRLDKPSVEQEFICRTLIAYAKQGLNVVRLKGGDPGIFGRMEQELTACKENNIAVEIIPGITAACAAAAELHASLTLRGVARSVTFVTPRVGRREANNDNQWIAACLGAETIVMYMAGSQAKYVCQTLIGAGKPASTTICLVENASREGLRLKSDLANIARVGFPLCEGPVTLLIGDALSRVPISSLTYPDQTELGYRCETREFATR